eukprot:6425933-Amphidinium_carterae.2
MFDCFEPHFFPLEVYNKLQHVEGSFGTSSDPNLAASVHQLLLKARTTKANGCCLHLLKRQMDPPALRVALQREIKEVRGHALNEQHVLHPQIWKKVQSVMYNRV